MAWIKKEYYSLPDAAIASPNKQITINNKQSTLPLTIKFTHHLPNDFHPDSRIWIYQSDRMFSEKETEAIDEMLRQFTDSWTSHGAKVKGFGKVFFNRFIVLMADETSSGVSGCSTDSSVRLIK